jgi:tyrosinase
MRPSQIARWRAAFRELDVLGKWTEDRSICNNIAVIHQNHCQHGWDAFFPSIASMSLSSSTRGNVMQGVMPHRDRTMPEYRAADPGHGCVLPKAHRNFFGGSDGC